MAKRFERIKTLTPVLPLRGDNSKEREDAESEYRAREVRAKTHEVYEYDHDETKPGKPLHILIPGGLIALAVLALIVFIGYQTWIEESLGPRFGVDLILILAPFYVGGVFLFSYGYELYNIPRAIRLTAIIVFVTVAAVVIVAVLFLVLGNMKGGSGSSSKSKSSSRSSSRSSKVIHVSEAFRAKQKRTWRRLDRRRSCKEIIIIVIQPFI
jgi:hypothetical protein